MSSSHLTAYAAVAAVVVSLVNVGLSAHLLRRQDSQRWIREHLPELIAGFDRTVHGFYRQVFAEAWDAVPLERRSRHGMDQAREAMAYLDKLKVFARPSTIIAARNSFDAVDAIRMHYLAMFEEGDDQVEIPWDLYWAYVQAHHIFLTESRREMGLQAPPALRREVLPPRRGPWAAVRAAFRSRRVPR
ncbi:hypothetical protein ACH4TQ_49325 [Streptomyces sp. NPDC021218]|uniref:hypothetical protein n=1 Tax=unclassified Streptomyces TaxID=2593676 RepID=UPI00369806AB